MHLIWLSLGMNAYETDVYPQRQNNKQENNDCKIVLLISRFGLMMFKRKTKTDLKYIKRKIYELQFEKKEKDNIFESVILLANTRKLKSKMLEMFAYIFSLLI